MSEINKDIARIPFEVWNSGELERLDSVVAIGAVHHDPYDPNGAEGLVGLKKSIAANRARYPDLHIDIDDQVADADRVATRWTARMTVDGKPATMRGITLEHIHDGKIVETWRSIDMLGFLQQLGQFHQP
ncbi:ester cyclase [Nocardia iowensis]|uniref:Ester cyclase n=1 Tax=Nocardia iowensis TaxID=204891 RepID=A0ABX8RZM5_NOCIO|nr:ester cyclase [Nocardia iowensis]QXN94626.1 ester cyclase [Nocardia iowensis]